MTIPFGVDENNTPFGFSYLIDLYDCAPGAADSLELAYRFAEELVNRLDMTPMSPPIIIHGPRGRDGKELFPEKAGVSGWQPLIESGIQIHSLEPSHFITLDVYSCKPFTPGDVRDFAIKTFGAKGYEEHFIPRGINYKKVA